MARINSVVGEINPSVYNAAKNANLAPQAQVAVEQLFYTVKKAKELRALKVDDAKREFQALTEEAQTNMKALYPTAKFTQEDPSLLQRGLGVAGKIGKLAFSPIISTLQVAIAYGKGLNTGYVATREIEQGANPFSKKTWDDAYNADMDKAIRIIKDYDLYELSLVDSPANQFASIISVEKVNGHNVISGASVDAVIENVFYDSENGIVLVSDSETAESPVSGKNMENIGFVEKSDDEKANMIKFLVDSAKGISTIKITKEVNKMTEATEAVLDAVVENVEITPEAQPAEVETPAVVEAAATDTVVEKSDDGGAVPSAPVVEEESVAPEVEAELAVAKSDESVADAIAEIKNSLTNAFGDLATTIKSLNEQVAALNKSVDDVSTEVTQVKGQFNEFGKRVDAVEQDTAFRKSGDLGEIVQFEPVKVQKSLWGGRFLKNSDLFN